MSKLLDGSCSETAKALGLSPWATLALRVSLMILRRITWRNEARYLKVDISLSKISIRVSRSRRSASSLPRKPSCTGEAASGSMAITAISTGAHPLDALSSDYERDSMLEPLSPEEAAAI